MNSVARSASRGRRSLFVALWLMVGTLPIAQAQRVAEELAGARDPAIVSRYPGSILYDTATENFEGLRIAAGPRKRQDGPAVFEREFKVEGKISAYFYVQRNSVSPLEVYRNYVSALTTAGFKTGYACDPDACDTGDVRESYRRILLDPRPWSRGGGYPGSSSPRRLSFWSGQAQRGGVDVHVVLWVTEANSVWNAPTATVVVVEPQPMKAGQVTASLEQLKKGLQAEGRIALYGLFFDTGKAEVKPESKPQLDEMAKLLKAEPGLRVFIVGHTDNQGSLEANLPLSQRRAEAVAAALASQHGIDPRRLSARGVANFAPLASNAGEDGRARNRRVELVMQ